MESYTFKFIIIGNSGTGKSCILERFIDGKCMHTQAFPTALIPVKTENNHTIGVEFGSRTMQLGEKNVTLQVWDTAG